MRAVAEDDEPRESPSERLATLSAAVASGDRARFAALYEHAAPALHAWASLRIPARLSAWIEPADLVQEVWVRAWRAAASADATRDDPPLRAWLLRIAKNVLLEAMRRADAAPGSNSGGSTRLLVLAGVPDDATAVSRRVARDEDLARFVAWARELDEEERRLLVLCALEGASYAEAAERLGCTRDALAKRWPKLRERAERVLGRAL